MNVHKSPQAALPLIKADPALPALKAIGPDAISIRAGTIFADISFSDDTSVQTPAGGFAAGKDYAVICDGGMLSVEPLLGVPTDAAILGGFHFAPGGNASARSGGDEIPQINPHSLWDQNFRPACPDPRGMVLVEHSGGRFWCDIYLLAQDHLFCTSRLNAVIADGDAPPEQPGGGIYDGLDYATAATVLKQHGKGLLSLDEFFAAAFGVKERSAASRDPKQTRLDASRTSRWGVMQATGNMWVWGHDGDPDEPRPSFFGGSWVSGSNAGSRYAYLGYWPAVSYGHLGVRGRSDHLQLA